MSMNIHLPQDVVLNIFSRLPVKSLLRFRSVSKLWKIFINDTSFINMHLNHSINNNNYEHLMLESSSCLYSIAFNESSSLADDKVVKIDDYPFKTPKYGCSILGSCNGLLLININYKDIYCIWNPSTKEFKKLPHTRIKYLAKRYARRLVGSDFGFGYDKIIEDYKVVRIVTFDDYSSKVEVYTLGSDSWRRIQDIPDTRVLAYGGGASGKLLNGVLHWLVESSKLFNRTVKYRYETSSYIILSFDIEDEKYGEIQHPDFIDSTKLHKNVEVLGGCLCILCDFNYISSDIWVMKEYGVKESWTKLFTIPWSWSMRPIKFTKNGEVLFVKHYTSLAMYDPKDGSAKTLQIPGLKGKDRLEIGIYVESLISLHSGTFVGQEQAACKRTPKNRKRKDRSLIY